MKSGRRKPGFGTRSNVAVLCPVLTTNYPDATVPVRHDGRVQMTDGFSIVRPDAVSTERFDTCETSVRKLTEPLDCTEMRLNQVVVDPGEVTTPRTHDDQEEVFVAMTDGQIAIEGDVHDVPNGGIVRVPPEAIRNLLNRTGIFSTAPEPSQPHRGLDARVARYRRSAGRDRRRLRSVRRQRRGVTLLADSRPRGVRRTRRPGRTPGVRGRDRNASARWEYGARCRTPGVRARDDRPAPCFPWATTALCVSLAYAPVWETRKTAGRRKLARKRPAS